MVLGIPIKNPLAGLLGKPKPKAWSGPMDGIPGLTREDFDQGTDHVDGITGNKAAVFVNKGNPVAPDGAIAPSMVEQASGICHGICHVPTKR